MNSWKKFFKIAFLTTLFCLLSYFALYVLVDPYDRFYSDSSKIPAQPKLNERFFLPALAHKMHFNSMILGTSTIQLLKPKQINQLFKERFVNLAMASATAYEQSKLFDLFLKNHPNPETVIFGVDIVWCEENPCKNASVSHFPEFLFQENRIFDFIKGLSQRTGVHTLRQLMVRLHIKTPLDRSDGYRSFLPPPDKYSLSKARQHIYGQETPLEKPACQVQPTSTRFNFPQAHYMESMLAKLPAGTKKIIIFVPYHFYLQSSGGIEALMRWNACKERYKAIVLRYPNAYFIDFMIDSYITTKDENYWDPLHYNLEIAERLGELIYKAVKENKSDSAFLFERSL